MLTPIKHMAALRLATAPNHVGSHENRRPRVRGRRLCVDCWQYWRSGWTAV